MLMELMMVLFIPLIRSVAGWAIKALEDNKITKYEFRQLIQTVINVTLIGFMTYVGLNECGVDISVLGATASAYVLDKYFGSLKDNNNVTKR